MTLTDGLQAYYKFTNNTNDSSGNGNTATNSGATLTTDKNSVSNQSYQFTSASSGNMYLPYTNLIGSVGTISLWIKSDDAGAIDKEIFSCRNGSNYYIQIRRYTTGYYQGVLNDYVVDTVSARDTNWHHIVITWDSASTWKYYFDTTLRHTGASGKNPSNTNYPRIGAEGNGNVVSATPIYWDGKIDEIRIYNRVLSTDEITALYTGYDNPVYSPVGGAATNLGANDFGGL